MLAGGFQNQPQKIGVVDLQSVFQSSDYFQQKQGDLKALEDSRSNLLDFIHTYKIITPQQADRYKTLALKTDITPAEKGELTKLQNDIQAANQAFTTLQTKQNPTADDVAKLKSYNDQARQTDELYSAWQQQFGDELARQRDQYRKDVLDRVTSAVQDYAKKQGYTLVFASDVAPFGTNDVTPDTLKVMNAKK